MPPLPTLAGTTLGRYRLEALLGRGGMAEVYRALDTKLDRTVAVKVILPAHATNPRATQRFLHEARLVASLEHPHILPIYDFGDDGGQTYLVMPLLPGGSLAERIRGHRVPAAQSLVWLRQLAEALDAAHAAGVVHRDVKPANALLGAGDRLFLADFGIGRMLEAGSGLTATGAVLGTPAYMAPEQAQGRPATPAADRYALGVIAFEMLAGRPPFLGESVLSVLHLHVSAPVPVASTVAPELPPGVDATLSAALAKEPAARPPSCRALVDSLEASLHGSAAAVTVPLMDAPTVALQTAPTALAASPMDRAPTVTEARRVGRPLAVVAAAAGGALITAAGLALLRPRPAPAPAVTLAAGHADAPPRVAPEVAPTTVAPSATLPITVVEVRPDPRGAEISTPVTGGAAPPSPRSPRPGLPADPAAPVPLPAPSEPEAPAAPPSAGDEPESLRRRLEQAIGPGHRPTRADFEAARDAARDAGPERKGARVLLAFAQGGLDYLDRRDAAAGQALVEAFREPSRPGLWEMRPFRTNVQEPDGAYVPPTGWKLALAYADARGEAEELIAADLARRPGAPLVLFARATLRRQQGRDAESIADASAAYAARPAIEAAASIAELLGDTYNRLKQWEEAVRWYRAGVEPRNALTGRCAYAAARLLTVKLDRDEEARPLLTLACRSDVKKACAELGERSGQRPAERHGGRPGGRRRR